MSAVSLTAPVVNAVHLYLAPVERVSQGVVAFDAATQGRFDVADAPAGWCSAGAVQDFAPMSEEKMDAVLAGSPAQLKIHTRAEMGARVSFSSARWSALMQAVHGGSERFNLLQGDTAWPVTADSTASNVVVAGAHEVVVGDLVVADVDYTGQTGYVGAFASTAYVNDGTMLAADAHYVRRVSLNVARVIAVEAQSLTLDTALPAGVPAAGMQVMRVAGYDAREGGSLVQEWSALFVADGMQGDRVIYHYPRLQTMERSVKAAALKDNLYRWLLQVTMRAMPVVDTRDGSTAFCYRSYLPAPMREA